MSQLIQRHRVKIMNAMAAVVGIFALMLLLAALMAVREAAINAEWLTAAVSAMVCLLAIVAVYQVVQALTRINGGVSDAE